MCALGFMNQALETLSSLGDFQGLGSCKDPGLVLEGPCISLGFRV